MKKIGTEFKWGIIFSIIAKLWMLLEKLVGLHGQLIEYQAVFTYLFAIPAIIMFVLALRDKRKNYYNGIMTWIEGFVSGLIMTAVITLLMPVIQYVTHTFITPDFFENAVNLAIESGKMGLIEARKHFNINNYIIRGMVGSAVLGTTASAIIAFFLKENEKSKNS